MMQFVEIGGSEPPRERDEFSRKIADAKDVTRANDPSQNVGARSGEQ
jgi:hypothetical protein